MWVIANEPHFEQNRKENQGGDDAVAVRTVECEEFIIGLHSILDQRSRSISGECLIMAVTLKQRLSHCFSLGFHGVKWVPRT
jgi:hypothetical protein